MKDSHLVTLKSALNRIVIITLALVGLVSFALIFSYSQIKQTLSVLTLEELLRKNSAAQAEALLPSFLMPEQRGGISVLLSRFKDADGLKEVQVIGSAAELPREFAQCPLTSSQSFCVGKSRKQVLAVVPIAVEDHRFGYLLKTKNIPNFFANDHLLLLLQALVGIVILSFLILFLFLGRITTHELPSDLAELVLWVERLLKDDRPSHMPQLRFKELQDLGDRITEILRRHESLRDQAMIGQLTSGIMHDLRNPLHPLVTAFQLVEESSSPEKRLVRLENLHRVCKGKLPVIGEIIESTLDGGREIAITPELTDLRKTVIQALSPIRKLAEKKAISLTLALGVDSLLVTHDAVQMSRVFSNLFKNAVEAIDSQASPKEGPSEIRVSFEKRSEEAIHILFEDSGPGLPANAESVFRVFRSTKPRGSGLGLVVSRKIVETHQGLLVAGRSQSLAGARFEVVLPLDLDSSQRRVL